MPGKRPPVAGWISFRPAGGSLSERRNHEAAQKALESGFRRGNGDSEPVVAQHSPGPWLVSRSNPWHILGPTGELVGSATYTRGYQASLRDWAEVEANARVMAAGPAMLAALEALERAVRTGAPESVRAAPAILLSLVAARAAIADARGTL